MAVKADLVPSSHAFVRSFANVQAIERRAVQPHLAMRRAFVHAVVTTKPTTMCAPMATEDAPQEPRKENTTKVKS